MRPVLCTVKTEFGKFGKILDRAKKQKNTALKTFDESSIRTRAMERKLRSVEQLPAPEAEALLALPQATADFKDEQPEPVEADLYV